MPAHDSSSPLRRTPIWMLIVTPFVLLEIANLSYDFLYLAGQLHGTAYWAITTIGRAIPIVLITRLALRRNSLTSDLLLFLGCISGTLLSLSSLSLFNTFFRDPAERSDMLHTFGIAWNLLAYSTYWLTITTALLLIYRKRMPILVVPVVCGVALLAVTGSLIADEFIRPHLISVPILSFAKSLLTAAFPLLALGLFLRYYAPLILSTPDAPIPTASTGVPI